MTSPRTDLTAAAGGAAPSRLDALYRAVVERVAPLDDGAAAAWIERHGLLSMARVEALPAAVRERLRERARDNAVYNLYVGARFRELAAALAAAGIPVCPLKGIFLLDRIYRDDPASRVLGDLDLLVPEARLDEAVARLAAGGALQERPSSRRLRRVYPERVLTGSSMMVELHGRLGYKHCPVSAWNDVAPVPSTVHGEPVFALDRETTLVHLVSHLVKHRPLSRLVWVEDVLRWVETGVDAARAVEVAGRLGALHSLVAGIRVLRRLVGEDLLPGVPASVPGMGGRLLAWNEERIWGGPAIRRLPDPARRTGGRAGLRSLASAVLLADRPGHALRAVAVKAAEVVLRQPREEGE